MSIIEQGRDAPGLSFRLCMLVSHFAKKYRRNMAGDYAVTWRPGVDFILQQILANKAEMSPAAAHDMQVTKAMLSVTDEVALLLLNPDAEVIIDIFYRINKIPATFHARLPFFVDDLLTLEPTDASTKQATDAIVQRRLPGSDLGH